MLYLLSYSLSACRKHNQCINHIHSVLLSHLSLWMWTQWLTFPSNTLTINHRSYLKSREWTFGESSPSYQSIFTVFHRRKSMTWGRVNDDWMIILGWTSHLIVCICLSSWWKAVRTSLSSKKWKALEMRANIETLEFWFDVLLLYMLSVIPQLSKQRKTQLLKANCL